MLAGAVATQEGEHFVAWYEPDHHIVQAAAPFFARRFANLVWTILTPERSAHWNGTGLVFGPGPSVPAEDELEAMWLSYCASIFNPARLRGRSQGRCGRRCRSASGTIFRRRS
jgi:uracil-DNA glycosylase